MEKICLIQYLPNEILENILIQNCISLSDIINFSSTCNKFRCFVNNSNKIWKINFKRRWSTLIRIYDSQKSYTWKDEFQECFLTGIRAKILLEQMSFQFWRKDELSNSDLIEFELLLQKHPRSYYFLVNQMIRLMDYSDEYDQMTLKYYTQKVLRWTRQYYLKQEWEKFMLLPPMKQTLEWGATLVAQWCQPLIDVDFDQISNQLDEIANDVRKRLIPMNINITNEQFEYLRNNNIGDNLWTPNECNQILNCLRHVLFNIRDFQGNNELYYSSEYSYINKVLEYRKGIPITLTIVFESVARRLGIKCEPVNFPAHFLLRWRESYKNDNDYRCFYIDVFQRGRLITKRDCPRYNSKSACPMRGLPLAAATTIQVIERIAINLELASRQRTHLNGRGARLRSALELLHLVNPMDITCILHLARYYMLYNMELDNLLQSLKALQLQLTDDRLREQAHHIIQMLEVYERQLINDPKESGPPVPKQRVDTVKYAIGMVMRHVQFHYRCVIFGWDSECAASQEWIQQMGVDNLDHQHRQPFYNVMVEDGSIRYAAQENLEVCRTRERNPVNHVESGRYFDRYCLNHYIPNGEKAAEYPGDASVRQKYCACQDHCWELTNSSTYMYLPDSEREDIQHGHI